MGLKKAEQQQRLRIETEESVLKKEEELRIETPEERPKKAEKLQINEIMFGFFCGHNWCVQDDHDLERRVPP